MSNKLHGKIPPSDASADDLMRMSGATPRELRIAFAAVDEARKSLRMPPPYEIPQATLDRWMRIAQRNSRKRKAK